MNSLLQRFFGHASIGGGAVQRGASRLGGLVVAGALILGLSACSSDTKAPAEDAAATADGAAAGDRGGAQGDGAAHDTVVSSDSAPANDAQQIWSDAGPPPDDCVVKLVRDKKDCHNDCGVRLWIVGDGRYCTQYCKTTEDCLPYGANLKCASEFGACVPRCTEQKMCTDMGFIRCDTVDGICDNQ